METQCDAIECNTMNEHRTYGNAAELHHVVGGLSDGRVQNRPLPQREIHCAKREDATLCKEKINQLSNEGFSFSSIHHAPTR